jgi:hypothetical protein
MKVKYKGKANECYSCRKPADLRIWYATSYNLAPIKYMKVAYFCTTKCAAKHFSLRTDTTLVSGSKEALNVKLTTHALTTNYESAH